MDFSKVTNFLDSLHKVGIPGADLAIYLKGNEVYRHQTGVADIDTGRPISRDTIYQFYSMTKVITCVSALRYYEEGVFKLDDPVYEYLPEFKDMEVRQVLDNGEVRTKPAENPIRIVDLFTMTSGLTYNYLENLRELDAKTSGNFTLKEFTEALAKDPLFFEPGTRWEYGVSHDVLGRLIEVLSGKTLGEYFHDNIFVPLGMEDTFFRLPKEKEARMASHYKYDEETKTHTKPDFTPLRYDLDFKYESGGGGLLSTVDDYAKFANALCAGGTSVSANNTYYYHIISNATIELMRTNHLDKAKMENYSGTWSHHSGYGYGLGVRTMVDKAAGGSNGSIGEYGWSGMAGTFLLIDPAFDLTYVYAQQLIPSKEEYVAPRLRNVVYGCL